MVHLAPSLVLALAGLTSIVSAHPGHDVRAEAAERAAFLRNVPIQGRSLGHCAAKMKARGLTQSNIARREHSVQQLRKERRSNIGARYLKVRDLDSVLATDHKSTKNVNLSTNSSMLFGDSGSCIVQEEVTQGPYYVAGELVRSDLVEDQEGVPLYMDIQLIDVNTCEPIPQIYTDFWHCNATGVYSGVVASGNGDTSDEANLNKTFLRGIQPSDAEGVVRFQSIFPGHYTSRATHIHVATHAADQIQVLANGTLAGLYNTRTSHVGQLFFDQDLITEVEKTSPYSTNTQELTENASDSILSEEAGTTDPVLEYVLLGEDVSDGVFAWISIGINGTASDSVSPAAYYTGDGGVENEDSSMGGGGGGGGGGMGDAPSGSASAVPGPSSSASA